MKRLLIGMVLILSIVGGVLFAWQWQNHSSPGRYDLQGQVVSVDLQQRTVLIAHKEIPGYMEAMTMPFTLKEEWAYGRLKARDYIQATLVVEGDRTWLEDVAFARGNATEMLDVFDRRTLYVPNPGQEVPNFSLVNQDDKTIRLHQYRDHVLVLTFIYTRCPLMKGCPQAVGIFAEIHQALQNNPELQARAHLLSISFDPANDTPALLRDYGSHYTATAASERFAHWEFASGTEDEVKAIAQFFGLRYLPKLDQIAHLPRTAVVSPAGKVFKVYTDNSWTAADLLRDVQQALTH